MAARIGHGHETFAENQCHVDDATLDRLRAVGTAAAWSALTKAGVARPVMARVTPLSGSDTMPLVGRARTLRYLPVREDLLARLRVPGAVNPQRALFEAVGPSDVVVIDAGGNVDAGGLGDILATRLKARGIAGLVTDGSVRDAPFIKRMGLPVFTRAVHPAANTSALLPYEYDAPIQCGGVTVFPGDAIVGDEDGVVVIPAALASRVAEEAAQQEHLEEFLRRVVEAGATLPEAYPPSPRVRAAYEAWRNGITSTLA
jgi:regulator of RNase E activity RraA